MFNKKNKLLSFTDDNVLHTIPDKKRIWRIQRKEVHAAFIVFVITD